MRLVPFVSDYWHVVSDKHASIIGSLYCMRKAQLPWRAEFTAPVEGGWEAPKTGYFETDEEAMAFMRKSLEEFDERI